MSLRAVRVSLATALAANGVAGVYTDPPAGLTPPCVVAVPGDPYIEPETIGPNGGSVRVRFRLLLAVNGGDVAGGLDALEQLVVDTYRAMPTGWSVTEARRPSLDTIDDRELLTTEITVSTVTRI